MVTKINKENEPRAHSEMNPSGDPEQMLLGVAVTLTGPPNCEFLQGKNQGRSLALHLTQRAPSGWLLSVVRQV